MNIDLRTFASNILCLIITCCIGDVKGRGYQAGNKLGDGYGEKSIWNTEYGLPVWVSLLIVIWFIAILIVSCCCYKRCFKNRKPKQSEVENIKMKNLP